jgi:DNA primase
VIPSARQNEDRERVRDASDIVRVIGEHIALKAKGREFVGLCPFHDDHKPSMQVAPSKQIFKCFSCGAGGDVFTFVEKYHKMQFREALEYLAERGGVELSRHDERRGPGGEPGVGEEFAVESGGGGPASRAELIRANTLAMEFFRTILRTEHGAPSREAIQGRGIAPEMVDAFALGAAPDRWDGLVQTLQKRGEPLGLFAEAGLLKRREDGGYYDTFRNRLIFPIHDQIGRTIAFGGRKLREEDEPKYLNSPESRVFEKSGTLYGLHRASRSIQQQRMAIITEGYTDTIACHQAGFTNAVATLGTALTARHAAVLRRLCDTVVLLFDGDEAGRRAADRAVEVFFAAELDVKIATLAGFTDAKDPDELLKREGGAEALRRALDGAVELLEYRHARLRERLAGAGMAALNRMIEEELARLVQLGFNRVPLLRRRLIIKRLAALAGVDERTISLSLPGGRDSRQGPVRGGDVPRIGPGAYSRREQALGCIVCEPAIWAGLSDAQREALDAAHFASSAMAELAEAIWELGGHGPGPSLGSLCGRLTNPEHQAAVIDLQSRIEDVTEGDASRVCAYFADCMALILEEDRPAAEGGVVAGRGGAAAGGIAAGRTNRRVIPRPTRAV